MIFYFSSTGNSRWAARELAKATGEELVSIPDVMSSDCNFVLNPAERIGFVFPIHGWRPPLIVLKFVEKLKIDYNGHYCYALVTAGDNIGLAMDYFSHALFEKGMHVDSCISLIMPESYVGLPFMDVDTKSNEDKKKAKAVKDLQRFTDAVVKMQKGFSELVPGAFPGLLSGPVGSFFVKFLITERPFRVDKDRCISCGVCEKVCPVNDIKLMSLGDNASKKPVWQHNGNCLTCFSCYHHCPTKAIEYGHRTKHKGQYLFEGRAKDRNVEPKGE